MSAFKPYDWAAAVVAVLLVAGVIGLVGLGRECPKFLEDALLIVVGWLTRSSVGAANDFLHRERSTPLD